MRTSRPAARTTLPVPQIRTTPIEALAPGLELLCGFDPADPFITRQRRNIVPGRQRLRINPEERFQIRGEVMNDPASDALLAGRLKC